MRGIRCAPRLASNLWASLPRMLWVAALMVLSQASSVGGQQGAQEGEWRNYAGDAGSTKYSGLSVIDESNVQDLEVAWRWRSVPANG